MEPAAPGRRGMCLAHYKQDYYKKNRERLAEISRQRMAKVPKWLKAKRDKAYRERHARELAESKRAYFQKNKDAIRAYKKAHQDRDNATRRARSRLKPEIHRARNSSRKARRRGASGAFNAAQISNLYTLQLGRCAICAVDLNGKFHKDHIFPLARGGSNDIGNIQLLCVGCNCSKQDKDPVEFMQSKGLLL